VDFTVNGAEFLGCNTFNMAFRKVLST